MPIESEYDQSRVERSKRELTGLIPRQEKTQQEAKLSPSPVDVGTDWSDSTLDQAKLRPHTSFGVNMLKTLIVLAVLSVVASSGYLLYSVLYRGNATPEKIAITMDIPVSASPGVPFDIGIQVKNDNAVPIEYADLTITFPQGTRSDNDPDKELRDAKNHFNTILPGQIVEFRTRAILLGEENTEQEVGVALDFRFAGINSVFSKNDSRPVRMLASPINLTVHTLKEVNAGQTFEFTVKAESNTVIPLKDVVVTVEFPQGFNYQDADPKPTFGSNTWRIGTLEPAEKYTLTLRGTLSGEETQERVFRTTIGVGNDRTERKIDTAYAAVLSSMSIMRSFIGIDLTVNGKPAEEVVVPPQRRADVSVNWSNNLPTKIVNAQIEVHLSGDALDRKSILAGSGCFYRSIDDTVICDERGTQELSVLEAGESGAVTLSFAPRSGGQLITNPTIRAEVTVRGRRYDDKGVPEEVKTLKTSLIKVTSVAQFASRAVYYVGPFANYGPIPPKVETETSYTVIWTVVNSSNNISNAEVRATLPIYMKWARMVSPTTEIVNYNPNTNQIIWSAGEIPAGTGVGGKPPREVAFQLILLPSLSQVGQQPKLLTGVEFHAVDSFTHEELSQDKADVLSNLSTDSQAPIDAGTVTR